MTVRDVARGLNQSRATVACSVPTGQCRVRLCKPAIAATSVEICDLMSAFGPKQTSATAPHMSAFGGRADPIAYKCTVNDPKRTQIKLMPQAYSLDGDPHRILRDLEQVGPNEER
jgi:hypothetical protein